MVKKKPSTPNRTASHRLQIMLTDEEKSAMDALSAKERRDKTAIVKYALYQYFLEHGEGIEFPKDKKYIV